MRVLTRALVFIFALASLVAGYALVARPWLHHWGATDAELQSRLPGDEIIPVAQSQETRALTITAPASVVWAWVAQIGQDRGGFYSYRLLENLFGCEMPEVQTLVPALQQWKVGDKLWMYPPRKAGGAGFATLAVLQPGRALGFATRQIGRRLDQAPDASWSFIVTPIDAGSSRLIFRGRGVGGLPLGYRAITLAIFEPAHFVMERRTMTNVKQLAEGGRLSSVADSLPVILWTVVFLGFVVAATAIFWARTVSCPRTWFLLLGVLFQYLTLGQPHPLVGAGLVGLAAAGPWWLRRRGTARGRRFRADSAPGPVGSAGAAPLTGDRPGTR